jgi:CRP-like cAMP-binding protein
VCLLTIYKKGTEIYGEKEPAEYVYQVTKGAVPSYKLLSDGRRQIGAFHLAGDIFGLENGETHRFTAEAVVETTVRLIRRQSLEVVAETDAVVSRNLLSMPQPTYSTPKTTCCYWDVRPRWRRLPRSCLKWTSD